MANVKSKPIFNGTFSRVLKDTVMIISILSAVVLVITLITTRASNTDVAKIGKRVTVNEERGMYLKARLDKIDDKLDRLLERK